MRRQPGDHQTANARPLADAGAAIVLPESVLDAESLTRDIAAILSDADRASDMAEAARSPWPPRCGAAPL
jgi:UDP-N-acetylglucosamine--N-acetylmuramyl-(pentapeptide) pyrophosphoryl-undecaprenol N-acetylglucosamine transferase